MNPLNHNDITPESIARQKAEVLKKIQVHKASITESAHQLFAPIQPIANKSNGIMKTVNTGIAMFDGLMTGIKIVRSIRNIFR